jgi:hypothetical protein
MSYPGTQTAAARLIAEKGQSVTLTRKSAGSYDLATSSVAVTDAPETVSAVILPLSRGLRHMEGSNIQVGDQQLLLGGDIAAPQIDDTITVGSAIYTIVEVSPLNPGGTNLIYDCVIRGAA